MKYRVLVIAVIILSLISAPVYTAAKLPDTNAPYGKASPWAEPELDRAAEYGFISDEIKTDMTKPITREEFARLAVVMYEKYTGKEAKFDEILKLASDNNSVWDFIVFCNAFEVDFSLIFSSNLKKALFSPDKNITREQMALLYHSALKTMIPETGESVNKTSKFTDVQEISWWAVEDAYFMTENGFMSSTEGAFNPKGICSREMAVIIAVRIYEKYSEK